MNADPEVMRYFPSVLSRVQSDGLIDRVEKYFDAHGFGLWAVQLNDTSEFAGFIGIQEPSFEAHFNPCIEVGWRLARRFWGRGYATEGARAALEFGFQTAGLAEIVSFAVRENAASIRVMQRIGMHFAEEFDHPELAPGDPLRRHVLYRIRRGEFRLT